MQRSFNEVVEQILERDPRYGKEAYIFLKDALEFTIKQKKRGKTESGSHVNAGELLDGEAVERQVAIEGADERADLARNVDISLEAVEEIRKLQTEPERLQGITSLLEQ